MCFERIDQFQHFGVTGNVGHIMPIMDETRHTSLIHQHLGRHAPEFEQVDLLAIQVQDGMPGIGEAGKGQVIIAEIFAECPGILRTNDQDRGFTLLKLCKGLAQLRHVRAAEWSHKPAVENEQNIPAKKLRKSDWLAMVVGQFEIWCRSIQGNLRHKSSLLAGAMAPLLRIGF